MINFKRKKADANTLVVQEREHILSQESDFFIREAYNTLRSNITFSLTDKGCKVIAVTSTNPSEGKSITSLNIAVSYAEINKKVLLIDCDLRKPKLHKLLKIKSTPGFSNVLIDENEPNDVIQKIDEYGIDVITSGDIPPNSTQLLESEQLIEMLDYVKERYDYVILDTPPINIVIDACILAKHTSGIIYVIKQSYAKKDHIINAVKQLEFSQGRIIGFVLNDIVDKGIVNLPYSSKLRKKSYTGYKYKAYKDEEEKNDVKKNEKSKQNERPKQNVKVKKEGKTPVEQKNKKRKYWLIAILAVVMLLIGSAVVLAHFQENNLKAVDYAGKYSGEELNRKNAELDSQVKSVAEQIPNVHITPLTDEERKQLANGELTGEDALKIITGEKNPGDEDNKKKKKDVAEEVKTVSKVNELVAEFYLLKAEFLNSIDNLIAQGQSERHAIPKEERTFSVKLNMAKKYAKLGSELEEECDKKVASLIKELENELKAEGQSTSVIAEIKKLYSEEKAIKKAALIEAYYPKG